MPQNQPTDQPPMNLRQKRRKERMDRVARAQIPRVRVLPRDEDMRRVLKHPNGMAFRSEGSIEWPLDQFTKRRLKDGSVKLDEARSEQRPATRPQTPPASAG